MSLINGAELGRLAGVSRAAISKALKQGKLIKTGSKFDTDHPTNSAYIRYRSASPAPSGKSKSVKPVTAVKPARPKIILEKKVKPKKQKKDQISKPSIKLTKESVPDPKQEKEQPIDYDETDLSTIADMGTLPRADLERLKLIATIETTRVKTDEKRSDLIPRDLVRHVFSKIYSIDVNEFKNLGMNLAPSIAAITENDSPEITNKINELIDKELHSILIHIKRLVNDFLIRIESEKIK